MRTRPQTRPPRPRVVTIAAALQVIAAVVPFARAVPGLVGDLTSPAGLVGGVVATVVVVLWTALLVWLAVRMARGGPRARLALAVFSGLAALSTVIASLTTGPTWGIALTAAMVVGAVLSYLPSARGFFPKVEPRPRRREPKTLGWDPETGERIVEEPELDRR